MPYAEPESLVVWISEICQNKATHIRGPKSREFYNTTTDKSLKSGQSGLSCKSSNTQKHWSLYIGANTTMKIVSNSTSERTISCISAETCGESHFWWCRWWNVSEPSFHHESGSWIQHHHPTCNVINSTRKERLLEI